MSKVTFRWKERELERAIRVTNAFNKCSLFEDYNLDY